MDGMAKMKGKIELIIINILSVETLLRLITHTYTVNIDMRVISSKFVDKSAADPYFQILARK